ncbi:MAG: aminopeptidase P family protein [Anaerolineaceae bacterium]|nr:aminopeptidase P family protein [Anaerolineaceae bacterium]
MSEKSVLFENLLEKYGYDAAVLIPSPNMNWLTGQAKILMERPTAIIFCPGKKAALIIAGFEVDAAPEMDIPVEVFPFTDNPAEWGGAFRKAGEYLGLAGKKIAVEPIHFRFLEYQFIKEAIPGCQICGAQQLFSELRLRKSDEELEYMRKAAIIAQDALEETLKLAKPGVTERELGSELVAQMLRRGSDPKLPFDPIVGSGPNSANPHAEVSDRQLERGDFLLFDWGARYKGYCSDITRTFVIGEASDKQIEIYNTVLAANRAALAAVRPGVSAGSIDDAGRAVINSKGYGNFFTHRIGHGLGLEEHEEPYMFAGNPVILEQGMCFSDEPGIYIPDWGGVRIEDDITVTADAGRSISDFPRELRIL